MTNVYQLFLDSNFIILNGEPASYKRQVAHYILKRIEYNKAKSEIVSLLNLSFKTLVITNESSSFTLDKNNFSEIYQVYSEECFDFIIFDQIPNLEDIEWLKFKSFASKSKIQCIFIGPEIPAQIKKIHDLSLFAHFNTFDNSVDIICYNDGQNVDFFLNSFYI